MDDRLAARALAVGAFAGLVLGGALLLFPGAVIEMFGFATAPPSELLARLLGAESIGIALLGIWLGSDRRIRNQLVRAHFVAESVAGVASFLAIRASGVGGVAWLIPALYIGFALVWGYLLIALPRN